MTVRIVTDSVSDLPAQVVQELGVSVVTLNVTFGIEVYRDGKDMTTEQCHERLVQCKTLSVTLVPSPPAFTEVYDKLAEELNAFLLDFPGSASTDQRQRWYLANTGHGILMLTAPGDK